MKKMENWIKITIGVVLIVIIVFIVILLLQKPTEITSIPQCSEDSECELSLCDCKCYKAGQTPETLQGIACNKDCQVLKNIRGCLCIDRTCAGAE
jgi:type IV secretory pathway VirB6-like protein